MGQHDLVQLRARAGAQALLTRDLDIGSGEAHVNATRGFEVGALVRIYDRENSDYVVITEVGDKLIKWATETPVNRRHRAAAPTHLEVMTFEIHVAMKDRREVFKGLQMHPSSRNYAPRVVSQRVAAGPARGPRAPSRRCRTTCPSALPMTRLAGGRDGIEAITPEDFIGLDFGPGERSGPARARRERGGRAARDPRRDAVLRPRARARPASSRRSGVQDQMISICENQKDRFAILDIPQSKDIEWVRRWRRRTDSSFCAYYWPWLRATGLDDKPRIVPPSGLPGRVLRPARSRGRPPRAREPRDRGGSGRLAPRHRGPHRDPQRRCGQHLPAPARRPAVGRTHRVIGSRVALHPDPPSFHHVTPVAGGWIRLDHVRAEQPRDLGSRARPSHRVSSRSAQQGMLAGGNPEEAFFVKCDAETNPPEQVDSGMLDLRHRRRSRASRRVHHDFADPDDEQPRPRPVGDRTHGHTDTTRKDPLPVFCFKVQLDRPGRDGEAFFKSVSGLRYETEVVPVREGGANDTTFNLVGATKWSNLVLKQGFTSSSALLEWREEWIRRAQMTPHRRQDHPARYRAQAEGDVDVRPRLAGEVGDRRVRRVEERARDRDARDRARRHSRSSRRTAADDGHDESWTTTEPRALTAALAAPAFVTRGERRGDARREPSRRALGARGAARSRVRSMRSLGFVDRLVAPWIETAQRSASLRMFSQYVTHRHRPSAPASSVSWVFPRPWYQDELDWMAAARQVGTQAEVAPRRGADVLTTRGTYVAPARAAPTPCAAGRAAGRAVRVRRAVAVARAVAAPIAASVAVALRERRVLAARPARGGAGRELMSRAVAPLSRRRAARRARGDAGARVLTTMLERGARSARERGAATRLSTLAPELVTPPAPRPDAAVRCSAGERRSRRRRGRRVSTPSSARGSSSCSGSRSSRRARARRAAGSRVAPRCRRGPRRDARAAADRRRAPSAGRDRRAVTAERAPRRASGSRAARRAQRRQRRSAPSRSDAAQRAARAPRTAQRRGRSAERARIEERVAQRIAERTGTQRLHEQARTEAAAHARAVDADRRATRRRRRRGAEPPRAGRGHRRDRRRCRPSSRAGRSAVASAPSARCRRSASSTRRCAPSSCSRAAPRAAPRSRSRAVRAW